MIASALAPALLGVVMLAPAASPRPTPVGPSTPAPATPSTPSPSTPTTPTASASSSTASPPSPSPPSASTATPSGSDASGTAAPVEPTPPAAAPDSGATGQAPAGEGPGLESTPPVEASPPEDSEDLSSRGPAALPSRPDPAPGPGEAPAVGGRGQTPLPAPPPPEDPRTLQEGPWRGRGWIDIRFDIHAPVGGDVPARGNVVSAGGALAIGWRPLPMLGIYGSIGTFVHDRREIPAVDEFGDPLALEGFGRIVTFDLPVFRVFPPIGRRIQPWIDVGAGIGVFSDAFEDTNRAVGMFRTGLGVDFWVARTFTLSVGVHYRLLGWGRSVGHNIQPGLEAGIHW